MTKLFTAVAVTIAVTSCGTTPPRAIPVAGPGSFGEMISGLRDTQQLLREGNNTLQEFRRFRSF